MAQTIQELYEKAYAYTVKKPILWVDFAFSPQDEKTGRYWLLVSTKQEQPVRTGKPMAFSSYPTTYIRNVDARWTLTEAAKYALSHGYEISLPEENKVLLSAPIRGTYRKVGNSRRAEGLLKSREETLSV